MIHKRSYHIKRDYNNVITRNPVCMYIYLFKYIYVYIYANVYPKIG